MASEAARAIEAILMVAQEPVDPHLLAQVLEVAPTRVAELCDELQAAYEAEDRGFVLVKVAGGYRFQSHGDLAAYVERFVLEGQSARLSSAALETLAIVAYKQPISRAQVAAIRGVNVDGVMRTLQQRGYIDEVGRDHGPGQATLFGTTSEFLERLGLDSVDDLPPIAELFPSADVLEALEKGLRAEPIPQESVESASGGSATGEPATGSAPASDDDSAPEAAPEPRGESGLAAEPTIEPGTEPTTRTASATETGPIGEPAEEPEPSAEAEAVDGPVGEPGDGGTVDLSLPAWFTEAEDPDGPPA